MLRTFLSVAAAALLISVILSTPASSADTGEASIPSGEHRAWLIERDSPFTLDYDFSSSNATLSVIVVSAGEYNKYLDGLAYSYIAMASRMNVTNATASVDMEPGQYYIVVEDGSSSVDGSVPTTITYNINAVALPSEDGPLETILWVGVVAISVLVVAMLLNVVTTKKRR